MNRPEWGGRPRPRATPRSRRRIAGAEPIGPILMGLSRPMHVLQRGAEVNDIVNIAAVAVVDAQDI